MMIAQNTMWGISPNYRKTIRAFHPLWVKFSSDIGGEAKLGKKRFGREMRRKHEVIIKTRNRCEARKEKLKSTYIFPISAMLQPVATTSQGGYPFLLQHRAGAGAWY